jgi:hypothetical protein
MSRAGLQISHNLSRITFRRAFNFEISTVDGIRLSTNFESVSVDGTSVGPFDPNFVEIAILPNDDFGFFEWNRVSFSGSCSKTKNVVNLNVRVLR